MLDWTFGLACFAFGWLVAQIPSVAIMHRQAREMLADAREAHEGAMRFYRVMKETADAD